MLQCRLRGVRMTLQSGHRLAASNFSASTCKAEGGLGAERLSLAYQEVDFLALDKVAGLAHPGKQEEDNGKGEKRGNVVEPPLLLHR